MPHTLLTYSSYLDTAGAIYWLHEQDVEPSLSTLSKHIGKNKTTISDQVQGHLSSSKVITYEREASRIKIRPNPIGLLKLWLRIVRQRIETRQSQMKALVKSLEYQGDEKFTSLAKTSFRKNYPERMERAENNSVLRNIISHCLKRYGRSVTTQEGVNRGHVSNLLEWSFEDFSIYLAKESDIFAADLDMSNDESRKAHDLLVDLREAIRNPMKRFFLHEAKISFNQD